MTSRIPAPSRAPQIKRSAGASAHASSKIKAPSLLVQPQSYGQRRSSGGDKTPPRSPALPFRPRRSTTPPILTLNDIREDVAPVKETRTTQIPPPTVYVRRTSGNSTVVEGNEECEARRRRSSGNMGTRGQQIVQPQVFRRRRSSEQQAEGIPTLSSSAPPACSLEDPIVDNNEVDMAQTKAVEETLDSLVEFVESYNADECGQDLEFVSSSRRESDASDYDVRTTPARLQRKRSSDPVESKDTIDQNAPAIAVHRRVASIRIQKIMEKGSPRTRTASFTSSVSSPVSSIQSDFSPRMPRVSLNDLGFPPPVSPPPSKRVKRPSHAPKTPSGSSSHTPSNTGALSASQRVRLSLSGYVAVASLSGPSSREKSTKKEQMNENGLTFADQSAQAQLLRSLSCPEYFQAEVSKHSATLRRVKRTAHLASRLLPTKNSVDCLIGYIRELQRSEANLRVQLERVKREKQEEANQSILRIANLETSLAQVKANRDYDRQVMEDQSQLIETLKLQVAHQCDDSLVQDLPRDRGDTIVRGNDDKYDALHSIIAEFEEHHNNSGPLLSASDWAGDKAHFEHVVDELPPASCFGGPAQTEVPINSPRITPDFENLRTKRIQPYVIGGSVASFSEMRKSADSVTSKLGTSSRAIEPLKSDDAQCQRSSPQMGGMDGPLSPFVSPDTLWGRFNPDSGTSAICPPMFMVSPSESDFIDSVPKSDVFLSPPGSHDLKAVTSEAWSKKHTSDSPGPVDSQIDHPLVLENFDLSEVHGRSDESQNKVEMPLKARTGTLRELKLSAHKAKASNLSPSRKRRSSSLQKVLASFFLTVDPSKLRMAEVYSKRYKDHEDKLFSDLSRRYGAERVATFRANFENEPTCGIGEGAVGSSSLDSSILPNFADEVEATYDQFSSTDQDTPLSPQAAGTNVFRLQTPTRPFTMSAASFEGAGDANLFSPPPSSYHTPRNMSPMPAFFVSPQHERTESQDHEKYVTPPPPISPTIRPPTPSLQQEELPPQSFLPEPTRASCEPISHAEDSSYSQIDGTLHMLPKSSDVRSPMADMNAPTQTMKRVSRNSSQVDVEGCFVTLEALLNEFFRKHQPDKIHIAPLLAKEYSGKECVLIELLRKKYGSLSVKKLECKFAEVDRKPKTTAETPSDNPRWFYSHPAFTSRWTMAFLVIGVWICGLLGHNHFKCGVIDVIDTKPMENELLLLSKQLEEFRLRYLPSYLGQACPQSSFCTKRKENEAAVQALPTPRQAVNRVAAREGEVPGSMTLIGSSILEQEESQPLKLVPETKLEGHPDPHSMAFIEVVVEPTVGHRASSSMQSNPIETVNPVEEEEELVATITSSMSSAIPSSPSLEANEDVHLPNRGDEVTEEQDFESKITQQMHHEQPAMLEDTPTHSRDIQVDDRAIEDEVTTQIKEDVEASADMFFVDKEADRDIPEGSILDKSPTQAPESESTNQAAQSSEDEPSLDDPSGLDPLELLELADQAAAKLLNID